MDTKEEGFSGLTVMFPFFPFKDLHGQLICLQT